MPPSTTPQLTWNGGGLRGTVFDVEPHEGGWQIAGQGGHVKYGTLPQLDIENLHLRYRARHPFL